MVDTDAIPLRFKQRNTPLAISSIVPSSIPLNDFVVAAAAAAAAVVERMTGTVIKCADRFVVLRNCLEEGLESFFSSALEVEEEELLQP